MPTVCSSQPQYLFGLALRDILRSKEAREIAADDLIGRVAFDLFSAGIPTDYPALRIHHEDRMILHSIEDHPISLFTFSERFLHEPPSAFDLGQVLSRFL